jgi:hypothetical protein
MIGSSRRGIIDTESEKKDIWHRFLGNQLNQRTI